MTTLFKATFVVLFALLFASGSRASEPTAQETRIRQAIETSLPNLQRGATGSADQRECFTCHHQSVPIFALAAAHLRGFAVDKQILDRQVKHTRVHLQRGVEGYLKGQGQGGGVLTAGYAMWALDEVDWKSDEVTTAVAHYLKDEQRELPFWRHQGRRPPSSGSDFTATYVALRALSHFATVEQKESAAGRIAEVTKWLEATKPIDTEDHAFRLLCMNYLEVGSESREVATSQLVNLQRADGGWAQTDMMESDAYATATAMYALQQEADMPANDPVLERGLNWLLDSQLPDGTWHVTTRAEPFQTYFETGFPHGKDQFISMAASAWATRVLVSMLPVSDTQSSDVEKAESTPKSAAPNQDEIPTASVSAVGPLDPAMVSFDDIVKAFVTKHRIPAAAFAATDGGKIVFARGYQVTSESGTTPVGPTSLFRIASLSKPITAVGILQLVEQGRIELSTPVFSILNFENEFVLAGEQWDKRLKEVTIRQLLEHRGGWDRDTSFDPMFQSVRFAQELGIASPAGPRDIIRAMLTRPLDFDPGQRYAYSNFGYCLLGRVIETVSGMTYEAYIQQHVLKPIGIESMQLGKTRASDRAVGEVYYQHASTGKSVFQVDLGNEVPAAYGAWYLEAMDAHGGWIASVIDLARFASAFDDPDHCYLLRADSIRLMHNRPDGLAGYDERGQPLDVFYSLGWQNRVLNNMQFNRWHTGSLPGTTAIMIRRHDGRNLIALLSTRESTATDNLSLATDLVLHEAANSVQDWAAAKPHDNSLSVAR